MSKSLANKLRLKERLYTIRMSEGTSIQEHLDEFNSILMDLENLEVVINDEDRAVLLIVSLTPSYKHFHEIMLNGGADSLKFNDVKENLLSKEKFDIDGRHEDKESLFARGRNTDRTAYDKKSRSKSRGGRSNQN